MVLGGVAPVPWRLPEVETLLVGQRLTPDLAAKARRSGGQRRAAAREERLQGSADACAGRAHARRLVDRGSRIAD